MAYVTTNPPKCVVPGFGGSASIWIYNSADVHTDVDATDYFTDGKQARHEGRRYRHGRKDTATIDARCMSVQHGRDGGATISAAILA